MLYYILGLIILPPIAKVSEKWKFKDLYFETMILCLQTYLKCLHFLLLRLPILWHCQSFHMLQTHEQSLTSRLGK